MGNDKWVWLKMWGFNAYVHIPIFQLNLAKNPSSNPIIDFYIGEVVAPLAIIV
jgi:hypothetical protein